VTTYRGKAWAKARKLRSRHLLEAHTNRFISAKEGTVTLFFTAVALLYKNFGRLSRDIANFFGFGNMLFPA
jgi:hypothetical protein